LNINLKERRRGCNGWKITDRRKRIEKGRRKGRTRRREKEYYQTIQTHLDSKGKGHIVSFPPYS
jgi:hypothetical protein